jgi:hypothetical protein
VVELDEAFLGWESSGGRQMNEINAQQQDYQQEKQSRLSSISR